MSARFSVLARKFSEWATACRSPITVAVYEHYFRKFLAEVGDIDVRRLTPATLSAWAKTWHQSQAIVRLMRWCVNDARLIKENPIEHAQHPPKGERVRTLTKAEERRILATADADLRALLIGYAETMARPGELMKASIGDLFPRTTRARLRVALKRGEGLIVLRDYKNRKSRRLPNEPRVILLSPTVGRMIAKQLTKKSRDETPIWTTARNRRWTPNALRCRMRRLRSKLGIVPDARGETIVPYTWRHSGATRLTAAGLRDRVIADILGHVETATTKRYQHLIPDDLRRALRPIWFPRGRRGRRRP